VWDVQSGEKKLTLGGHNGGVLAVEFSPDGSLIATAGNDGTVRFWDAESGEEEMVISGGTDPISQLRFSPDGTKLATGDAGTIRIWVLDIDDLVAIANRELTRSLTDEECQQYLHLQRCR
jgi:WD40 repeat protein